MDFFAHQDRARRSTRRLVLMFIVAVVGLIAALDLATAIGLDQVRPPLRPEQRTTILVLVAAGGAALIAIGSLWKTWELRAGGGAVATRLGGREIVGGGADDRERRLLNVVEEMAIASGAPVPAVYVLDGEDGINAFAAGLAPQDAAIAVTRGALDRLDREQLQGVIGHEFSHLLNGDSRLNLRLIGVLHGILLIGLTGRVVLRAMSNGSRANWSDRDRRDRGGGGAVLVLLVAAVALMVLGSFGTFCGRLIQSAVSRSREFLADASAVQFTRNPRGLAGALRRIGAGAGGGLVRAARAVEASHLFFADAIARQWTSLLSTHPPLAARIRAIDPEWDGSFPAAAPAAGVDPRYLVPGLPVTAAETPRRTTFDAPPSALAGTVPGAALAAGQTIIAALPADVVAASRDPYSARAVIAGLVLDQEAGARGRQLALLRERDPAVAAQVAALHPRLAAAGPAARLPLVDLCIPALRRLSSGQHRRFADDLRALMAADDRTLLDEWLLVKLVLSRLAPRAGAPVGGAVALRPLLPAATTLLAALARAGGGDEPAVTAAFAAGWEIFTNLPTPPLPGAAATAPAALEAALDHLADAAPAVKRRLVDACAAGVAADAIRTPRECELLRVVCGCVGVPVPIA